MVGFCVVDEGVVDVGVEGFVVVDFLGGYVVVIVVG